MRSNPVRTTAFLIAMLLAVTVAPTANADTERSTIPLPAQSLANPGLLRPVVDTTAYRGPGSETAVDLSDPRDGLRRTRAGAAPGLSPAEQDHLARAKASRYADQIGGDDIIVQDITPLRMSNSDVAIAENGDIYVAMTSDTGDPGWEEWIDVFRSQDGGDSFLWWGSIGAGGTPNDQRLVSLCVAEGAENRCYVQYMDLPPASSSFDQIVTYSDLSLANASWTTRTLFDEPGVSHLNGELVSDAESFDAYYLYAVCSGIDGNGDDIWYTRSTDYGNSWSAPYRIAELITSGNLMYSRPQLDLCFGGALHVAWTYTERLQDDYDDGVRYRRALNYGGASTDWDPSIWALRFVTDGIDQELLDVSASKTTNRVIVMESEGFYTNPYVSTTDTGGADWNGYGHHPLPWYYSGELVYRGLDGTFVGTGFEWNSGEYDLVLSRASEADPSTWSTTDRFDDPGLASPSSVSLALDPSHGGRAGVIFKPYGFYGGDLSFDAEWRADPGYPNLEPGFPVDLAAQPVTPPAIVDVDDDPYGEIVFGDAAGDVWVYSHLGTVCDGWPRNVGELFWKSSIAVGALDLSGDPYIVAGTADGRVYAFAGDGTLHDGFPVDLGTGAATYVSIGALGPPHPRWIVACSGTRMFTISHSGTFGPYDWTYTYPLVGPAAIGDVDDDGVAEMVTLSGSVSAGSTSYVHVQQMDAPTQEMWRAFPSYSFSDAPTLFDLDSDGDLEIAAPTRQGALFVMHHDGSDVGGFPFDNFTGQPLTSAAAAQFIGTIEPDLAVASQDWRVHLLYHDGAQQSSYPEETGYGWWLYGAPIIDQVNRTSANIIVGSRDTSGWSFQNTGGTPAGWPKGLGGTCEYSPASGDIDLDGDNEIVFLTHSQLILVDVNYPPEPLADNRWPMFGYDPQRTGCLNCVEDLATAVPGVGITRVSFAEPSPNPATDTLVFHYQLPAHAGVRLEIFDLRGRRVRSVLRREETAGPYSVSFDGLDERGQALGAGQYLARLSVRGPGLNEVQTRKFTLVR